METKDLLKRKYSAVLKLMAIAKPYGFKVNYFTLEKKQNVINCTFSRDNLKSRLFSVRITNDEEMLTDIESSYDVLSDFIQDIIMDEIYEKRLDILKGNLKPDIDNLTRKAGGSFGFKRRGTQIAIGYQNWWGKSEEKGFSIEGTADNMTRIRYYIDHYLNGTKDIKRIFDSLDGVVKKTGATLSAEITINERRSINSIPVLYSIDLKIGDYLQYTMHFTDVTPDKLWKKVYEESKDFYRYVKLIDKIREAIEITMSAIPLASDDGSKDIPA